LFTTTGYLNAEPFSETVRENLLDPNRWTFQASAVLISANVIDDFIFFKFDRAKGEAGGEMYLFNTSYTLTDLELELLGKQMNLQMEWPLVFGLINERGRPLFHNINSGIAFRWTNLPFSKFVYANFETGVGLTYSEHVMKIERVRKPHRERSHLKIYWPIQLILAHPKHRQHQLVLQIHHQSGGHIFDIGGSNMLGLGYRYVFRER
jgi:hypothetical protein